RYGTWYKPPKTPKEALAMGYKRMNGICQMDTYHGFLYVQSHNEKSRLLFDLNDKLAGIQTSIPGNLYGFNANNESIRVPSKEVIPPILLSQEQYSPGVQMYTITAYFKHPSLICSPYTQHAHPGKGLYIQMGYRVDIQYEKIPLDAHHLSEEWKTGTCLPNMGHLYFKNLSKELPCERLYPVFLMYNDEGQLGGFGWLFQGIPPAESPRSPVKWFKHSVQYYPAIFDATMLPACMYNPAFHVFGIHIYLRNEHTMTCPRPQLSDEDQGDLEEDRTDDRNEEVTFRPLASQTATHNATANPMPPKRTDSPMNNIIVDDVKERGSSSSSSSSSITHVSFLYIIVSCVLSTIYLGFFSIYSLKHFEYISSR
ncbi:unnamed protein product, partial [Candidula unifasciata]